MKTIHIILPVNNPDMLNENDLIPFQSREHIFTLSYVNTDLIQLNTVEDVKKVIPLVSEKIEEVKKTNPAAIILYAFGDVGITSDNQNDAIPIIGLGRLAIREANAVCAKQFTVIPAQITHVPFFENLIKQEKSEDKYKSSSSSPNSKRA